MQHAIGQGEHVNFAGFAARVPEDNVRWLRRPVVGFVRIAGVAAVEQVPRVVIPTVSLRLEMIQRQQTAGVRFSDAAVLASQIGSLANPFSQLVGDRHAG